MDLVFEPVSDNIALSQKIVATITDAIVHGRLKPGDRLPPERALAIQFQVSRTAIRDAIKILSGRGLLEVRHGVGIFVTQLRTGQGAAPLGQVISASEMETRTLSDLFEIRKTLETQTAFWAARRADVVHMERLRGILEDACNHRYNLQVLSEGDAQFHVAIAEASQNLVLVKLMWTLLDMLAEGRKASLSIPNRPMASLAEHEQIVSAIESRDGEGARNAMLHHLGSVEQSVFKGGVECEESFGPGL